MGGIHGAISVAKTGSNFTSLKTAASMAKNSRLHHQPSVCTWLDTSVVLSGHFNCNTKHNCDSNHSACFTGIVNPVDE